MTSTPSPAATPATAAKPAPETEQVLPGVWRWADPGGSDRCGTALTTDDGLVLVDPPAFPAGVRRQLESRAGPVRHVVLTSARHASLAAPYRAEGATAWAPRPTDAAADTAGIDRAFGFTEALPGGLAACPLASLLPAGAAPDGEVSLLWPRAGKGLLITGDILPVVGQTPVYREGAAPPMAVYLDAVRALLAADPGTLAPVHQAPAARQVALATAYAAYIGSPPHARRAAPIAGPRYLVPQARRVLAETLGAPVIVRRPSLAMGGAEPAAPVKQARMAAPAALLAPDVPSDVSQQWIPDPFACTRCGQPATPGVYTCGGPLIPRLCPACRALRRQILPAARLMVCAGGCCTREGARAVVSAARQAARARGLDAVVDVVPVSCLGECTVGPFLRVATAQNEEPAFAAQFREQTFERARRYAAAEGEELDEESELVLSRFAALVQPAEAEQIVDRLARDLRS